MKKYILSLSVLLIFYLITSYSFSQDSEYWTQFRGYNSSGIASPDANPPTKFGEDENLKWKITLPIGSSSPVIWKDKIYLTAYIEEKNELQTICINRTDGEILWCDSIFPEKTEKYHAISSPAQSTPAVDEEGVYIYFASIGVKCFEHDGQLKWEYPMPCPGKKWGNPSSPAVIGDKIILNIDYGGKGMRKLLALNKYTGKEEWITLTHNSPALKHMGFPGFSTPIKFNDQVILHKCGGIVSYSITDGSPVWWLPMLTNGISTPIIYGDNIYVTAFIELTKGHRGKYFEYNTFNKVINDFDTNEDRLITYKEIPADLMIFSRPETMELEETQVSTRGFFKNIDKNKNDTINENEWMTMYNYASKFVDDVGLLALNGNNMGELSMDDILWMQLEKMPEVPSPIANDDCVYMLKNGGWLTCMDAKSGTVYYQERLGTSGACIASPVLAHNHIYLSSHNGTIKVIMAGKKPTVVHETKLNGKITATPAISNNDLYVRTSNSLYAFTH